MDILNKNVFENILANVHNLLVFIGVSRYNEYKIQRGGK